MLLTQEEVRSAIADVAELKAHGPTVAHLAESNSLDFLLKLLSAVNAGMTEFGTYQLKVERTARD